MRLLSFIVCLAITLSLFAGCGAAVTPPAEEPDVTTEAPTTEATSETESHAAIGTTVDPNPSRDETSESAEATTEATTEAKTTAEATTTEATTTKSEWIIEDTDERLYAAKDLNVREEPKASAKRITHVDAGDLVQVTGWVDNGWARIKIKDGEYFISGKYLTKDKPKEEEEMRAVNEGDKEVVCGRNMTLTFIDEFDSKRMDFTKWEYCPDWTRADRGGKWDSSQVNFEDGKLVLSVDYNAEKGHYVSGAIRSKNLFEQAYGYYECSMKVQEVPGFWSAFWLLSQTVSSVGNGAKDGVEIDIMEAYNYDRKGLNFALHWDGYGDDHKSVGEGTIRPDLYDGNYHTYGLLWTDDMYIWYVDGKECWRSNESGICEVPVYLKLSLEVGSWAGEIDLEKLPANVYVDYVRVYQFDEKA